MADGGDPHRSPSSAHPSEASMNLHIREEFALLEPSDSSDAHHFDDNSDDDSDESAMGRY